MEQNRVYTIQEAARQLQISRQTLYAWINEGEVEAVKWNGRQCITQSTLDELLSAIVPVEKRQNKTANYLLYEYEIVKKRRRHSQTHQ